MVLLEKYKSLQYTLPVMKVNFKRDRDNYENHTFYKGICCRKDTNQVFLNKNTNVNSLHQTPDTLKQKF